MYRDRISSLSLDLTESGQVALGIPWSEFIWVLGSHSQFLAMGSRCFALLAVSLPVLWFVFPSTRD